VKKQKRIHHHIVNRVDGGKSTKSNLLLIKERREKGFHMTFGNMTLRQAGELLIRTANIKDRQK
jgi:hypothetical protein